jgi:hypothetical protein
VEAAQGRIADHAQQGVEADREVLVLEAGIQQQRQSPLQHVGGQGQSAWDVLAREAGEQGFGGGLAHALPRFAHEDFIVGAPALLPGQLQVGLVPALKAALQDVPGYLRVHVRPSTPRRGVLLLPDNNSSACPTAFCRSPSVGAWAGARPAPRHTRTAATTAGSPGRCKCGNTGSSLTAPVPMVLLLLATAAKTSRRVGERGVAAGW